MLSRRLDLRSIVATQMLIVAEIARLINLAGKTERPSISSIIIENRLHQRKVVFQKTKTMLLNQNSEKAYLMRMISISIWEVLSLVFWKKFKRRTKFCIDFSREKLH